MPADSFSHFAIDRSATSAEGPWTNIEILNDKTTVAVQFIVPAKGTDVSVTVADANWIAINEYVNIALAGLFKCVGKTGNTVALTYLNESYNTRTNNVIIAGSQVLPGSYIDTTAPGPTFWYRVTGWTVNGITVSYNIMSITAPISGGGFQWVSTWGSTTNNDNARAVATDLSGNVWVVGDVSNSGFIRKYNPTGALLWEKQYSGANFLFGVCTDADGNGYVVGSFLGSIPQFDPPLPGNGANDVMFVVKYGNDAGGTLVWAKSFPAIVSAPTTGLAVCQQGSSLWITGKGSGTVNFGGGNVVGPASENVILLKLNISDGGYGGVGKMFGRSGQFDQNFGAGIDADSSGNVYVTGRYHIGIDFGTGEITSTGFNCFVVKFNSAGTAQWTRNIGGSQDDWGNGLAVNRNTADVYAVGQFRSTVDFGAGFIFTSAGSLHDGFLVKMNGSGVTQWAKQYGGDAAAADRAQGVAVDGAGNIIACGLMSGGINFGGGVINANFNDAFVVKYNASGTYVWARAIGSFSIDNGWGCAFDPSGNVVLAGSWYGAVDFGDGIIRNTGAGNGSDAYVVKYTG